MPFRSLFITKQYLTLRFTTRPCLLLSVAPVMSASWTTNRLCLLYPASLVVRVDRCVHLLLYCTRQSHQAKVGGCSFTNRSSPPSLSLAAAAVSFSCMAWFSCSLSRSHAFWQRLPDASTSDHAEGFAWIGVFLPAQKLLLLRSSLLLRFGCG